MTQVGGWVQRVSAVREIEVRRPGAKDESLEWSDRKLKSPLVA